MVVAVSMGVNSSLGVTTTVHCSEKGAVKALGMTVRKSTLEKESQNA